MLLDILRSETSRRELRGVSFVVSGLRYKVMSAEDSRERRVCSLHGTSLMGPASWIHRHGSIVMERASWSEEI
jgi:hypothetical protein